MSELKSCPFCGRKVELDHEYGQYVIHQPASGDNRHGRLFMRANEWNVRPIEDALQARIAELEAQQRWIPVSERLPEKAGTYLVYYKKYLEMANFDLISTKWQICFAGMITDIDYWMPLPEPPEVK